MILIDGIGRSGTSLLGRLVAGMLEPEGWRYFYEPMHHDSPVGTLDDWTAMIGRVLRPEDDDPALESYIRRVGEAGAGKVVWKEIRLALKQDWLLARFPDLRIVHLTRDILGTLSSHRRPGAPGWMDNHRRIWIAALAEWHTQAPKLRAKKVPHLGLLDRLDSMGEFERYAALWVMNESFAWRLRNARMLCVEYEDLCLYPLDTLKRIAAFLGAPFGQEAQDAALRQMRETMKEVDAAGPGAGVAPSKMPEIWRERLTPEEVRAILGVAGEARTKLGYPAAGF